MKTVKLSLFFVLLNINIVSAVKPPGTSEKAWQHAHKLAEKVKNLPENPVKRTEHPRAQWFPDAGFGLFIHWGIHSVAGVQPSWAMLYDKEGEVGFWKHTPESYYKLAKKFDPNNYDPDKWCKAAKEAGMTYAVLTTKHHDGYTLWPSKYGNMGVQEYLGGRDLVRPFVEACRKYGLKVGLYFSPRDWWYPGYQSLEYRDDHIQLRPHLSAENVDANGLPGRPVDPVENKDAFEDFYAFTVAQLEEILTRYGEVDVLWFDLMRWYGIQDVHVEQTYKWIREVQPGIVINDRWDWKVGDFVTPEMHLKKKPNSQWWEFCCPWQRHWGYAGEGHFKPNSWVLKKLAQARSWGGNMLLNCGPSEEGEMPDMFYERCEELGKWMDENKESLTGAGAAPEGVKSKAWITTGEGVWYVHVFEDTKLPIVIKSVNNEPVKVEYLSGDSDKIRWKKKGSRLVIRMPEVAKTELDRVVKIVW